MRVYDFLPFAKVVKLAISEDRLHGYLLSWRGHPKEQGIKGRATDTHIVITYHMFDYLGEFSVSFAPFYTFQGSSRHNVRSGSFKRTSSLMYRSGKITRCKYPSWMLDFNVIHRSLPRDSFCWLDFGRHKGYSFSIATTQGSTKWTPSYRILRSLKKIRIKCILENPKPCVLHRRNHKCVWLGGTPQICCH